MSDRLGQETSPSPNPAAWSSPVAAFEVCEVSTSFGSAFVAGAGAAAGIAALACSFVTPASLAAAAAALAFVVFVASSTSSSEQAIANNPRLRTITVTNPYWNFFNIHILRSYYFIPRTYRTNWPYRFIISYNLKKKSTPINCLCNKY